VHDWHLANEILKTVLDYANKNGLKMVSKIELELGDILEHGETISPQNLKHNLKLLSEETIVKNAKLNIKKIQGDNWKLVSIEE
jgi:Zn finger protein HypA/HybF involved in hydrogenase expression